MRADFPACSTWIAIRDEADDTGRFAASLDDLKQRNDGLVVLQRESEEGFVRYLLASLPKFIPEYVDIKRVNAGLLDPRKKTPVCWSCLFI